MTLSALFAAFMLGVFITAAVVALANTSRPARHRRSAEREGTDTQKYLAVKDSATMPIRPGAFPMPANLDDHVLPIEVNR